VLVDRSTDTVIKSWPVNYSTMFHMTNDSGLFRTRHELEEQEGAYPIGGNRFRSAAGDWVPLYKGKMVQAFDHRAASVVVNPENQHRPAQPQPATLEQHSNPDWLPGANLSKVKMSRTLRSVQCGFGRARSSPNPCATPIAGCAN
jgi:hypothetical protein